MLKFSILILKFIRTCSAWQGQELLIQKITPVSINKILDINPFAPGDFAEKRVLKLVEWFSGHCRAIKS